MALRGKPASPGMGKLEIPSVYISFSPWLLDEHCKERMETLPVVCYITIIFINVIFITIIFITNNNNNNEL